MSAVVSPMSLLRRRASRASDEAPDGGGGSRRWRERWEVLAAWAERSRQRRRLLALSSDPGFLNDVGLSRADAVREAGRPFWKN